MHDQTIPLGLCQCGCGEQTPPYKETHRSKGIIKGQPSLFLHGHRKQTAIRWEVDPKTGCWVWQSARNIGGYGFFRVHRSGSDKVKDRMVIAHRWAWEREFGPIPPGMQIDHLCCNRACVRPHHLDVVTAQENCRRTKVRGRGRNQKSKTRVSWWG